MVALGCICLTTDWIRASYLYSSAASWFSSPATVWSAEIRLGLAERPEIPRDSLYPTSTSPHHLMISPQAKVVLWDWVYEWRQFAPLISLSLFWLRSTPWARLCALDENSQRVNPDSLDLARGYIFLSERQAKCQRSCGTPASSSIQDVLELLLTGLLLTCLVFYHTMCHTMRHMILSIVEFAKRSGLSRRTVQRMLKDGRLKSVERIVKTHGITWPVDNYTSKVLNLAKK